LIASLVDATLKRSWPGGGIHITGETVEELFEVRRY